MIHQGDCIEVMRGMADASVDSIVTDPPYGLGFMGKKWDIGVPAVDVFVECLRVLKPGGHLLAFGGTRTSHRLVCAIEDAGFEIRDTIAWLYGSGFPKSRNVGKEVAEFEGWGTALKPAMEPICVARKLLDGTVAANVQEHRTGALNVDACRVPSEGGRIREGEASQDTRYTNIGSTNIAALPGPRGGDPAGRWPANVIHDGSDEVLEAFPDAKGQQGALTGDEPSGKLGHANTYGRMDRRHEATPRIDASASAARFFYCAKASRKDRNEGCEGLPEKKVHGPSVDGLVWDIPGSKATARANNHPTVKPTDLMRYLCRLVTPPGGIVLDPFAGSGSTGKAAVLEGFQFVGIELEPAYVEIARARIAAADVFS